MKASSFDFEMKRITDVFGIKNYPSERIELIWNTTKNLSDESFNKIVNYLISSFRFAPLPKDFDEAAKAEIRSIHSSNSVPDFMAKNFKGNGSLEKVLARDYPGCKTLYEAVQVERLRIQLAEADKAHEESRLTTS